MKHSIGILSPFAAWAWLRYCFIDRAIEDVEALCDVVQAQAHQQHPVKFLGPGSFKGILGTTGGHLLKGEEAT